MSIIAVRNIPSKGTMPSVVKVLANAIRGEFEALEFAKSNKKDHKICYVRLSEKLDAMQVIETIMSKTKYSAYLPNNVPNLAPASKKGKIPLKTRLRLRIPQSQTPDKVMVETHAEILTELQCKYTGLFNLSKKTGHKLLESIAQTVFERLKEISDTNPEVMETGFMLSKMYRKLHPHFGDFQLILSTLHKLQDAAGVPRLQLAEAELMSASAHPFSIDNVSMDKILIVSNKYTEKIVKKITEHVDSFNLEVADGDSEEEVARKKVREHLKKMSPYYSEIVKQVISNHFIPPKSPFHRVRIYGEPFLPNKEIMEPFVRRFRPVKVMRSDRMYNVLRFNIPPAQIAAIMAMDGTVLRGATLVIRSSDRPYYKVPVAMVSQMMKKFGMAHSGGQDYQDEEMGEDNVEDWADEDDEAMMEA